MPAAQMLGGDRLENLGTEMDLMWRELQQGTPRDRLQDELSARAPRKLRWFGPAAVT